MSKAGRKKEQDGDVLRAGDIVPPYGDVTGAPKKQAGREDVSASPEEAKAKAEPKTAKSVAAERQANNIPRLNLDKQILAEQRKVASVRRKGPGAKSKAADKTAQAASARRRAVRAVPELSEKDHVIAEIVARDIQRLCGR